MGMMNSRRRLKNVLRKRTNNKANKQQSEQTTKRTNNKANKQQSEQTTKRTNNKANKQQSEQTTKPNGDLRPCTSVCAEHTLGDCMPDPITKENAARGDMLIFT